MGLKVQEEAADSTDTKQSCQTFAHCVLRSGHSGAYSPQCCVISNKKLCPNQTVAPSAYHAAPTCYKFIAL
jgi:hypothetical protein